MRNKTAIIFFINLFIYSLFIPRLFAVPTEMQEIKKIETAQQAKTKPPLVTRPRVEYRAESFRDPFQGRKKEGEGGRARETQPPALITQGIVWGGSFPQAIINNRVVKIGEIIEGARIVDINKNGVTVFFEGRQYNLPSPAAGGLPEAEQKGGTK